MGSARRERLTLLDEGGIAQSAMLAGRGNDRLAIREPGDILLKTGHGEGLRFQCPLFGRGLFSFPAESSPVTRLGRMRMQSADVADSILERLHVDHPMPHRLDLQNLREPLIGPH